MDIARIQRTSALYSAVESEIHFNMVYLCMYFECIQYESLNSPWVYLNISAIYTVDICIRSGYMRNLYWLYTWIHCSVMYSVPGDRIHLDYTAIHLKYSRHTVVLYVLCVRWKNTVRLYLNTYQKYSCNTVILSVLRVRWKNTVQLYLNTRSE